MALRAGCSFCLFAHSCLEGYTEGGGNKWARFKWKHHCQVTKNRPKQCTRAGPGQRAIHQGHRALCAMCYPAFQGSTPNVPPSTSGQCIQCVTHQGQHTQLATQHLRTWSNEPLTGAITISTFPVIQGERPKGQADSSLKINLLDSGWGVCRGAESKQNHKKRHVFHAPLSPILTHFTAMLCLESTYRCGDIKAGIIQSQLYYPCYIMTTDNWLSGPLRFGNKACTRLLTSFILEMWVSTLCILDLLLFKKLFTYLHLKMCRVQVRRKKKDGGKKTYRMRSTGVLSLQTAPVEPLLGSSRAVQACQDAENLEGSHIQVTENMPMSVIAVFRAALHRVQSWN